MINPFDALVDNFTATIFVFFVLLAILAYVAIGKKAMSLLLGILRALLLFFSTPFVYLKMSILELSTPASSTELKPVSAKQYMLTKFMVFMQALLFVVAVAILSGGLVSAWNQLVPSSLLRETISATTQELKDLKSTLQETEPAVKQMETTWTSQREAKVAQYKKERDQRIEKLREEYSALETRIATLGETVQEPLNELKNSHVQNNYLDYTTLFETPLEEMASSVNRLSLPQNTKLLLHQLTDIWYAMMLTKFEVEQLNENQLICVAYPEYYSTKRKCDLLKEIIPARENDLTQLRSEERYNIEGCLFQIVLTLLLFVFVVWIFGLFIESIWLSIDIATNIKKISDQSEKR